MALYKVPELTDFQWQTPVTNQTTNTPPSVAKGARYIVGSSPTDAWVGYSKYIATYNGSSWDFTTPIVGMICYITAESLLYIYSGSVWGVFSASQVGLGNVTNNAQVIANGTVGTINLIPNGDFENWSAGTSAAPDGWTLGGSAGLVIAREGTIKKINSYSLKLTTASLTGNTYSIVKYIAGRTYTYSCWVYATAGSTARLSMYDGVTQTYSSYHTGNSTWQQLTMSQTLSASATTLVVYVDINATSSSAYFDGAMCVEGASAFAYSAHAPDEGVWLDYSAVSTIIGWTSFTHKKIYIKVVGNLVHVLYYIEGQSDSTSTSFTVPYTSKNVADLVPYGTTGYAQDAGVLAVSSGIYGMLNDSTTISFWKNNSQPAWTNSSTKAVVGVLYYEKA